MKDLLFLVLISVSAPTLAIGGSEHNEIAPGAQGKGIAAQSNSIPRHLEGVRSLRWEMLYSDDYFAANPADTVEIRRLHDPWLSLDKIQHFTFSFLFTVGGQYTYVNKLGLSENGALPLSIGTAATIGLLKELYDWQLGPRRYFGKRDLVANSAGILAATAYILIF